MALRPSTPHFNLPFRLGPNGANVVEQDTVDDVTNCVIMVASTHVGTRPEVPDFGIPGLEFKTQPIGKDAIQALILVQEPRAQTIIDERPDVVDNLIDHISIGVGAEGGDQ